jgi:SAM-dependent methyltransferase
LPGHRGGRRLEQRFTFDQAASLYNRARPDYPSALRDDIVAIVGLRLDDAILDVGCGTGQATRLFAPSGCRIVALDPGAQMIEIARENSKEFADIEYVVSTFEAWPATPAAFRLVLAGQSWHWVAPEIRFAKAAEVLTSDGCLAVFGNVPVGLSEGLLEPFKEIYFRHTGSSGPPPEAAYLPSGPFMSWFDASGLFGPVTHRRYAWKQQHTASSYVDLIRTFSHFRLLTPVRQETLSAAIFEAIRAHGKPFEMFYETHLYLAARAA